MEHWQVRATPAKRQVLQSLAWMYQGNALLFRWGLTPSLGLNGIPVPIAAKDDWQRICDDLTDEDLVLAGGG